MRLPRGIKISLFEWSTENSARQHMGDTGRELLCHEWDELSNSNIPLSAELGCSEQPGREESQLRRHLA